METHFDAAKAWFEREKMLWAEAWQREAEMQDEVLSPWGYRLLDAGVPVEEMLDHDSAPELLDAVAKWSERNTKWRVNIGLPFVEGYPVEDWAGLVPLERRAAVLFRVANHLQTQGEVERAKRLRRWGARALVEELRGARALVEELRGGE